MGIRPDILLVGGYGVVGRRLAARLAPLFPDRVVIAGRSEERARELCAELGGATRPRRFDASSAVSVEAGLDGVGTVVACVAQRELHLLRGAVARGAAYTDLAPRRVFAPGLESLDAEARRSGSCVVLGAGLSPGISNVMARKLVDVLGPPERLETAILLGLGDEYGPDSLAHVLDVAAPAFQVYERGRWRPALPFGESTRAAFPDPIGTRRAYLFPWSDVVHYPRTLGAASAMGHFALDPPWAGRLASAFVWAGGRRWLRRTGAAGGNRRVIESLARRCRSHDAFALVVTAVAAGRSARMSLAGRRQADVTAAGAAEIARRLAAGEVEEPGVWLPEQVLPPGGFFDALAREGWNVTRVGPET